MYEWDENKNISNLKKHGIDFTIAVEVFSDPAALTQLSREQANEERYKTIGKLMNETIILFVVYTKRVEKFRIISARKASKKERQLYENQN